VITRTIAVTLVVLAGLFTTGCSAFSSVAAETSHGRIVSVADGDTVTVRLDSGAEKSVRLLAIDSPEKYATRYGSPAECGSLAASAFIERFDEHRVVLVSDRSQEGVDRYGRLLRYVDLVGGTDLAAAALSRGLVMPYVYGGPAHRYARYRSLAVAARSAGRGSWGHPCEGDFHSSVAGVQNGLDE
jgi:micrococcal nuclease